MYAIYLQNQLQSIKCCDFALISGFASLVSISHPLFLLFQMQVRTWRFLMQWAAVFAACAVVAIWLQLGVQGMVQGVQGGAVCAGDGAGMC